METVITIGVVLLVFAWAFGSGGGNGGNGSRQILHMPPRQLPVSTKTVAERFGWTVRFLVLETPC